MSWWRDILRQCVFMCFFIIPIPIGAYTIHSGSSAVVAMVSYVFLSLVIPVAYVGCHDATFGPKGGRIRRWVMALMWFIVFAAIGPLRPSWVSIGSCAFLGMADHWP